MYHLEDRRVVITGMGVVAPNGIGLDAFWDSLIHGRSAVRKITHFDASSYPSQIAAEVPDFDPTDYMDPKTARRLGRFSQFALAASKMAVEDSAIDFAMENPYRSGVFLGTAIGGLDVFEIQHLIFVEKGIKRISPFACVSSSTHSASAIIACEFNLKGPNTTISAGCNTGLDATYLALNTIRLGDADLIVVGSGEAPLTPFIHALFCATGFMSPEIQQPSNAVKPYDKNADGIVLGEGGATLILEEFQHAKKRGAKMYAEICGYSALNEAFDLIEVAPSNGTMVLNLRQTLEKSNIDISKIDYINAHGNGMLSYDVSETQSIKEVFHDRAYDIPVTTIKPITGHSIGVTPLWQIITSLLIMQHDIIPPTINIRNPDPRCDLNYVTNGPIQKNVNTSLINAHGFGGRLTALTLRKVDSDKSVV